MPAAAVRACGHGRHDGIANAKETMDSKQLQAELKAFRQRLKQLRNQYNGVADRDAHVEVEDKARRAFIQLGRAQDSLDNLADELARADKHMAALAKAERRLNTKRKTAGDAEVTAAHDVHRDFRASELFKLK
jgi:phage-related tail protein